MTNCEVIEEIGNQIKGIRFEKIEGFSCVGDYRSGADKHPIRYYAYTNRRDGDDDPFEGEGWTPSEALRDLLKTLKTL